MFGEGKVPGYLSIMSKSISKLYHLKISNWFSGGVCQGLHTPLFWQRYSCGHMFHAQVSSPSGVSMYLQGSIWIRLRIQECKNVGTCHFVTVILMCYQGVYHRLLIPLVAPRPTFHGTLQKCKLACKTHAIMHIAEIKKIFFRTLTAAYLNKS